MTDKHRQELESQINALRLRVSRLKRQLSDSQQALRRKNLELDALGRVWCSGGCRTGMYEHSPDDVTAEQVRFLVNNALRAQQHYDSRHCNTRRGLREVCPSCTCYPSCVSLADRPSEKQEGGE